MVRRGTKGYKVLKEVKWGSKGLTRDYKGFQGVQSVTKGYKG